MSHVTCYMSQVICLMLHVICHICHILHIRNALHVGNGLHSVLISSKYISHVNLSHVTCHMLHVTCHVMHFTCHMSYITCPWKCHGCMHAVLIAFNLCHISICHMWHVTCNMSLVTWHMPQVMCHMSHVLFHMSLDMSSIVQHCSESLMLAKWTDHIGLPDSPEGQSWKLDPALCQGLTLKTKTNYEILYIKIPGTTVRSLGNRGCDIWQ